MPGYFATMGIRLIAGRDFTDQDDATKPQASSSSVESFARSAWPGQDPFGTPSARSATSDKWLTVVGVVADTRYREIETARGSISFSRTRSSRARSGSSSSAPQAIRAAIAADVRRAVRAVDPSQPVGLPDDGRDRGQRRWAGGV